MEEMLQGVVHVVDSDHRAAVIGRGVRRTHELRWPSRPLEGV